MSLDFLLVSTRTPKRGAIEIYPTFIIGKSADLMIRGGDFYAIWVESTGLWSTEEQDALQLIDAELDKYYEDNKAHFDSGARVLHMWDSTSGMVDCWHKYCQKQMRDSYHMLDEKIIFANASANKKDYASKRLSYPLEAGDCPAYEELMSTLYSPDERRKIEWAIGSIVTGDSKHIQKFIVLYGSAGTGKSTVLNIIQLLFDGYCAVFDAKALGCSTNSFALEAFKSNPLVAIQHDGDLSHIEDNTRLNSLVSHEIMTVNEKFKSTYANRFKSFLFMGTNRPVKITDARSGLIRRLIDVAPTGEKLDAKRYKKCVQQIPFELGAIATRCQEIYLSDPSAYDNYIPLTMLGASNDFYNFVEDSLPIFIKEDGVTLKAAWAMYNTYCNDAKVPYPFSLRVFKEELRNYFKEFKDRYVMKDDTRVRNYYQGFRIEKFEMVDETPESIPDEVITFDSCESIFDKEYADCPAQYATDEGTPLKRWDSVQTKLSDLNTSELHYVKVPENHIVIDFDIPDETGNKSFEKNLEEASKWPATYAELSKSGQGIHLHYIYTGNDPKDLKRLFAEHIEIKVFSGGSSLRRKVSKCNSLPIASINSGLPLKEVSKTTDEKVIKSEKGLRNMIQKNLGKEIHHGTKPSVDFIYKILDDAYSSGMHYDVSNMRNAVLSFAANSTNQAEYCIKTVNKMKFKSAEASEAVDNGGQIVFFDVEVFPNLFLINWKYAGKGKAIVHMINPSPEDVENFLKGKVVGFNCRRYDNHIVHARLMGYDNEQIYRLSKKIITGQPNCMFGEAYNLSYTDVYDFCSKKQSLKKWEIELGIHHQELGLDWDTPVPEELWPKVADYCDNDVLATEAVFDNRKADFLAREILADVAGMSVNDTTNSLTTRIIFGNDRKPQAVFNYRNMGDPLVRTHQSVVCPGDFNVFDDLNRPIFPGYTFKKGKSIYRGEEVGEGGYVYAEPGMYTNLALLDIASMHPSSIINEQLFGEYTKRFQDIKDARVAIKHKDFENARKMLDGKLAPYLTDEENAGALAGALKIAINSVYGLTSASFDNPFHDPRNKDNIVAKRGALFMVNLKHAVQEKGFIVAHIKTDSIKIPDATPEIIKFVQDFGKEYGYNFEHEATYERMCLVNNAVYIARFATVEHCNELYGEEYVSSSKDICKDNKKHPGEWTATGTQFAVPYVYKTLFTKEEIVFEDLSETKSASTSLYLDMNENYPDVKEFEDVKEYRIKVQNGTLTDLDMPKRVENLLNQYSGLSDEDLDKKIAEGHNYRFIGKTGSFCPIKAGLNGGLLVREKDGKYFAATGTKGYRWLESETVQMLKKETDLDVSYYDSLVDEAIATISEYGDFEWFVNV